MRLWIENKRDLLWSSLNSDGKRNDLRATMVHSHATCVYGRVRRWPAKYVLSFYKGQMAPVIDHPHQDLFG